MTDIPHSSDLFDPEEEFGPLTPFDVLHGNMDRVLAMWRDLADGEPWAGLQASRLMNALPEILPRLFREAQRGSTRVSPELAELVTEAHGQFRRQDGVPLQSLAEEWNLIKRACWKVMNEEGVEPILMSTALQRIDTLIDDAIGFTLRGYYAQELEALRGKGLERRDGADERRQNVANRRTPSE